MSGPNDNRSILVTGGRVLDASIRRDELADLLIEEGKISAIEKPGQIPKNRATQWIDAKEMWVMPGFIDAHTHLREPGQEYKENIETGTRAAVAGGMTSVACMANTYPVNDTPYVTAFIRERAREVAACRVFPVGALSKGLKGEELAEIGQMVKEGIRAISDDGRPVMNSYLMRKALDYVKAFNIPVLSHAEDLYLMGQGAMNESAFSNALGLRGNPAAAEEIIVARDIALCRLTRSRVHFMHITTREALSHIRRAKQEGLPVTAEVSPHHLVLSEENVQGYDTNYKMSPPLRSAEDMMAMRKALEDGTIDLIATDHAPHGITDKALEYDLASNGVIGLQTALPVTFKIVGGGNLWRWLEAWTVKPAELLGIPYGTLQVGRAADVIVFDPRQKWKFTEEEVLSKSWNSPFLNQDLTGKVILTIVGGRVVFEKLSDSR